LLKLRDVATRPQLIAVYNALFLPHISYCIHIWGSCSPSLLFRILRLQKWAIRSILKLPKRTSCRWAFPALGIMTIFSLLTYCICLYAFNSKLKHDRMQDRTTRINTRLGSDFFVLPPHKIKMYQRSLKFQAPKLLSMLPLSLSQLQCPSTFKHALKNYLTSNPLYSKNEYTWCDH